MKFIQRWAWIAGAVATLTAAAFIAFALSGVQDASRAAGDLGELRAFAERIRSAAIAGDEPRLSSLIEQRQEHMAQLQPAIRDVLGAGPAREAFDNIERMFLALEGATRNGNEEDLSTGVRGVTAQVDLLLDLVAAERDGTVTLLRRVAAAGLALTLLGTAIGITANIVGQRRLRQLSLSESAANQRYEALISSMQNGILVLDDGAAVVYCNQALAVMLGYNAEELIDEPASRLVPAEHQQGFEARRAEAIEHPGPVPPQLTQCITKQGDRVDVSVAVTPLFENGNCVATLWEFRNVTSEVQLRQQVNLEVAKGQGVLGIAPVPIVVIDDSGTIIAANPAVEETLGWPPSDLVGQSVSVLMPEPFASQHDGFLQHYLETGEASTPGGLVLGRERPAFALHRDGRQLPVSIQVAEARMENGQRIFTGVIYDLTRQSNLEGERLQLLENLMYEQRDVAVGTMVGGIAHDFNNLLTAIIGALDLEISQRGESSRWLDHAAVAARRASSVVRRLLRTVRPHEVDLYPVDVWEVATETVELARETFDRRISIQAHRAVPLPLVLAEPSRLGQVLLNLLINARDATLERTRDAGPGYTPEIRVAAGISTRDDGECVVRLMVSDNGIGMTPEVRERLFDPFFTTKRAGKGSGLGLTMVRAIVREMDGDIQVESSEGVGTTITLDFPALVDVGTDDDRETEADREHRCRVLVVDDEESVLDIVSTLLRRHGCTVDAAPNGDAALEAVRFGGEYDLVLLDLNMPGISGWEVLAQIREQLPDLPVIVMSGTVSATEAARRGATGAIAKPFALDELTALVDTHLAAHRDGRGLADRPGEKRG